MRADDIASDLEEKQREVSLKYRKPVLPVRMYCYNCDKKLEKLGSFCDDECREDFEIRDKQTKQRPTDA